MKALINLLVNAFCQAMATGAGCVMHAIYAFQKLFRGNPRKGILVITPGGLGDVAIWLPYAQELRRRFPADRYQITHVVQKNQAPLITAFHVADNVISVEANPTRMQDWAFRLTLWFRGYFTIFIAAYVYPRLRLPYTIEKSIAFRFSDHSDIDCKQIVDVSDTSVFQRNDAVFRYLGLPPTKPWLTDIPVSIASLPEGFPFAESAYFVICPGAFAPRRQWPPQRFAEVAFELSSRLKIPCVLVGNSKEHNLGDSIAESCKSQNITPPVNLCGQTPLETLIPVVKNAAFLISNDTGTAHLGAVLKTRTFVLCGRGVQDDFFPYPEEAEGKNVFSIFSATNFPCARCRWLSLTPHCSTFPGPYPCIADISTKQVLDTILAHL